MFAKSFLACRPTWCFKVCDASCQIVLQVKPLPEHKFVFEGPISRAAGSERKASMEVDWEEFAPHSLRVIRVGSGKRKRPDVENDIEDGGEEPGPKVKAKSKAKGRPKKTSAGPGKKTATKSKPQTYSATRTYS